jgi:pseudaminic acid synthase
MKPHNSFMIGNREVGTNVPPFVIAEMSGNHNQSLSRALKIVEAAAVAGAHAIKLQTYTADTMTFDIRKDEFLIDNPKSLWKGTSLYQLYQSAFTPWEWHEPIFNRCKELGILAFSTPFDSTSVEFLEKLDVPAYKIASFENTDLPLIKQVVATGKPLLISTGMASVAELDETVETVRTTGGNDLVLLKCTSTYPAAVENTNLNTIPHMRDLFNVQVGLSDHTMGIGVAVASVAMGATVIEKHFTLARADGGVDSAFSIEPSELKALVIESERAWHAMGQIHYGCTAAERISANDRRSVYIATDLNAGDVITEASLKLIRPGLGLAPKYYELVIGKRVNKDIKRGTPLSWDLIG